MLSMYNYYENVVEMGRKLVDNEVGQSDKVFSRIIVFC